MNDSQRNRLRMYKATRDYLTENEDEWNDLVAAVTAHTELGGKITVIDNEVAAQGAPIKGHTASKESLRTTLENLALVVANSTESHARATGNLELLAIVQVTASGLAKLSDQLLDDLVTRVEDAVNPILMGLADYGVTEADMLALSNAKAQFEGKKTVPDVKLAARKAITGNLEGHFKETTELLKGRLDTLMTRYQFTKPNFYAGYRNARAIKDLRGPGAPEDPEDPEPEPDPEP